MTKSPRIESDPNRAFITLLPQISDGIRVAVKDLIDLKGVVTTAGSKYVAAHSSPASSDAKCISGLREASADIVGKTNLHELAYGTTGINKSYGTAVNPLDARRVPGCSSSGSAVAVATDACDVALGTDTGGSVRIPAACCGIAGLKTTYGRIPTDGVWPLAPSFDIVGPIAKNVDGLVLGMTLLEPEFRVASDRSYGMGRVALTVLDSRIDRAVDGALMKAGFEVSQVTGISEDQWEAATSILDDILAAEAAQCNSSLRPAWQELQIESKLMHGSDVATDAERLQDLYRQRTCWQNLLTEEVTKFGMLALPTLKIYPPLLTDADREEANLSNFTGPISLAGLPAVVIPIPSEGPLPASLQIIGPPRSEESLLAAARQIEKAIAE
jgi:amidase